MLESVIKNHENFYFSKNIHIFVKQIKTDKIMSMSAEQLKDITNKHFGVIPVATLNLKHLVQDENIHKKISDCIIEMITSYNLPYYGEFCQFVNFFEAKIGTCGVNITEKGMNFYWDREWIEKRTRKEVIFTIVHEVFHLLFDHQKRGVGYDHKIANLAADMIINSIIHGDLMIGEGLTKMIEIPKDEKGNNVCVFLPKDYTGMPIFEEVYFWLLNKYSNWRNENSDKCGGKKQISVDKDGNINVDGKKYCKDCGQEMKEDGSHGDQNKDGKSGGKEESKDGSGQGDQQNQDKQKGQGKGDDAQDGEDGQDGEGKGKGKDGQDGQDGQGDGGNTCPNCGQEKGQGQGQGDGQGEDGDGEGQEGQGDGQGKPGKGKPQYGTNGKSGDTGQNGVDMYPIEDFFENIEQNKGQSFDIHFEDDVPEAARKQFVESVMEKLKSRGLQSGNIEKILNKLRKAEKDYLKEIKRNLSNDIFGSKKQKSITKPNRRGVWGLKGTRKYKTRINCLLDTSGSMGGEFERVLSYIFQNDIEINMIQCDTEVKDSILIKEKRELERMQIKGLGGTTLTPGLQYIASDKELNKFATVILTDGYTDSLDFRGLKKNVLVLSTGCECPTVPGTNSNSIKIKQIIIDKTK